MGRTKNLAIEEVGKKELKGAAKGLPEHFVGGKEVADKPAIPLPKAIPAPPQAEKITDGFLIQEPLLRAVLTYLSSRPYAETVNLIGSLSSLPRIPEIMVTKAPNASV